MSLPGDKFEMVAGEWIKEGGDMALPLDLPWPRQLKNENGKWQSQPESGINVFVLMKAAKESNFTSPYWLTLREGELAGATLKDNEEGVQVASWRWRSVSEDFSGDISKKFAANAQGSLPIDKDEPQAVAMRPVVVFNLDQWEGLVDVPQIEYHKPSKQEALEAAEMMVSTEAPCEIRFVAEENAEAFYNPSLNYIQIPEKETFSNLKEYYRALFEQFGHALASKHNMNLWEGETDDVGFKAIYAKMVSSMLAYEAGVDILE